MKSILSILLWIWQLPQNIAAVILKAMIGKKNYVTRPIRGVDCVYTNNISAGVSLGCYIFVKPWYSAVDIRHECGHCVQSRILGPLYLIVIGLPSIIHNVIHWWLKGLGVTWNYYSFPTEAWADKLGNKYYKEIS